jgi:hypothetical protein
MIALETASVLMECASATLDILKTTAQNVNV